MATHETGSTWADVAVVLIAWAREDFVTFLVTILLTAVVVGVPVRWFCRFLGADRIQTLANAYLTRLKEDSKTPLTHDEKRTKEHHDEHL